MTKSILNNDEYDNHENSACICIAHFQSEDCSMHCTHNVNVY